MLKKYQSYAYYIVTLAITAITAPSQVLAAIKNTDLSNNLIPILIPTDNGTNILTNAAVTVINLLLLIAGILAVIYLIWSGMLYITAGGDTGKADKGRTGIVNAIIGLVIISAAYLLVRFVGGAISGANDLTSNSATI
ncbi:MAG: hypothetical protein ACD_58C00176G0002 [uncultured bacterium]|nr:MAG: hypothetical protein ACD_58C00176G0002 [uncultured bacterium]